MSTDVVVPGEVIRLSPNHAGPRVDTRAIVVHASGGKGATTEQEYVGLVNFVTRPNDNSNSCPHYCIGPDVGELTRTVHDDDTAWHATVDNPYTLGIEEAHSVYATSYTDGQYANTAELCARWCRKYNIPRVYLGRQPSTSPIIVNHGILGHSDLYSGYSRGKVDPGAEWDWNRFIPMVEAAYQRLFGEKYTADYHCPDGSGPIGQPFADWLNAHPDRNAVKFTTDGFSDRLLFLDHLTVLFWRKYLDKVYVVEG